MTVKVALLDPQRQELYVEVAGDLPALRVPLGRGLVGACAAQRLQQERLGLIGAVELEPIAGQPTKRAFSAFLKAYEDGLLIRTTGDILALSPPLIAGREHLDRMVDAIRTALRRLA